MKSVGFACVALLVFSASACAQEEEDTASSFTRVKGGAVYDYKMGVDGTLVSEEYMLTHITCSDGSNKLRVLLPLGPDDNGTTFSMGGDASTLKKHGQGWVADFKVNGKRLSKDVTLKPVNDPKSHYKQQYEIALEVGDVLWKAMRVQQAGEAFMMIGTGGAAVWLPDEPKLTEALKSCGISTKN